MSPVRTRRIFRGLCLAAALAVAAGPAAAGIDPTPFLNFLAVTPPDDQTVAFEVTLPSAAAPAPVEILSLSLVGTSPAVTVGLTGRDGIHAAIISAGLVGGATPDDNLPIAFDLHFDVAPLLGSNPRLQPPPDDIMPGPVAAFDVLFDTLIDGGIVHHTASFQALGAQLFSNVAVGAGSVAVGFDLSGPFSPDLFTVTVSGSAEPVPEPAAPALVAFGLAGIGALRRRSWRNRV